MFYRCLIGSLEMPHVNRGAAGEKLARSVPLLRTPGPHKAIADADDDGKCINVHSREASHNVSRLMPALFEKLSLGSQN